jgi:hypothetical protein
MKVCKKCEAPQTPRRTSLINTATPAFYTALAKNSFVLNTG